MAQKYRLALVMPTIPEAEFYTAFALRMSDLYATTQVIESAGGKWMLETHDLNGGMENKLAPDQLIQDWQTK